MQRELGFSTAQLTGAFSLALLISGVAGIAVGRYLDRRSPRALMTAGSIAGALLVLAWSRVDGLAAFYALWAGIGLVMATVLYEPAFVVLAKWFPAAGQRRRALTALTLVAALGELHLPAALPGADRRARLARRAGDPRGHPRRHHHPDPRARAAPGAGRRAAEAERARRRARPRDALRSAPFWLLSAAFFLATFTGIAMTVLAVPVPGRARLQRAVRRLRRRADRLLADPRPHPLRRRRTAYPRSVGDRGRVRAHRRRHRAARRASTAPRRRSPGSSCSAWATA